MPFRASVLRGSGRASYKDFGSRSGALNWIDGQVTKGNVVDFGILFVRGGVVH